MTKTRQTTNTNEAAQAAFVARLASIQKQIATLQALANDHFCVDPDSLHWGHVGDLGRIEADLAEILGYAK